MGCEPGDSQPRLTLHTPCSTCSHLSHSPNLSSKQPSLTTSAGRNRSKLSRRSDEHWQRPLYLSSPLVSQRAVLTDDTVALRTPILPLYLHCRQPRDTSTAGATLLLTLIKESSARTFLFLFLFLPLNSSHSFAHSSLIHIETVTWPDLEEDLLEGGSFSLSRT